MFEPKAINIKFKKILVQLKMKFKLWGWRKIKRAGIYSVCVCVCVFLEIKRDRRDLEDELEI